jgi:hypothetical protein
MSGKDAQEGKSPLSQRDRELWQMPPIYQQLPIGFRNGRSWKAVDGRCYGCGRTIEPEHFRGLVSRPFENVAVLEAVAACRWCSLLTRYLWRLHDDLRITGRRGNEWISCQAKPEAGVHLLVGRLTRMLRSLFYRRGA